MSIEIREAPTGNPLSFKFKAFERGLPVGYIEAYRMGKNLHGNVAFAVENVFVQEGVRRAGVATKLYEAAAERACERGGKLASTVRTPGAYSHDFWRKQHDRGRAVLIERTSGKQPAYMLTSCDVKSLSGSRKKKRKAKRR
jgi:GNAT superfamily N-acetyltransferase